VAAPLLGCEPISFGRTCVVCLVPCVCFGRMLVVLSCTERLFWAAKAAHRGKYNRDYAVLIHIFLSFRKRKSRNSDCHHNMKNQGEFL